MTFNNIAFVFARGGSKGLPRKNLLELGGKPLIAWSIESALSLSSIRRVVVSTDDREIAEVSRSYGAEVPFIRPDYLAQDNSPEWDSWIHALEYIKAEEGRLPDSMISLPATSPLRSHEDVQKCIDLFYRRSADIVITVTDSHRNPYFNMVTCKEDGYSELICKPDNPIYRRQDSPKVYDMTTVAYFADPKFIISNRYIFHGRVSSVHIPIER